MEMKEYRDCEVCGGRDMVEEYWTTGTITDDTPVPPGFEVGQRVKVLLWAQCLSCKHVSEPGT